MFQEQGEKGLEWNSVEDVCIMMLEEEVEEEVFRRLRGNNQKRRC